MNEREFIVDYVRMPFFKDIIKVRDLKTIITDLVLRQRKTV